jgi:hypothetical protein
VNIKRGLTIRSIGQLLHRSVPRNLAQVSGENFVGLTKHIRCDRMSFGEIASHTNALRALTGEK